MNQSAGKCLIWNNGIPENDASSLTDDGWKTLVNLVKPWSSVDLQIDRQYYKYMQVHELSGDTKTSFCKQYRSGKFRPTFGRHSLINKLKKDKEADKSGTETAAASMSLPSDVSLLRSRSSTTRTHSSSF